MIGDMTNSGSVAVLERMLQFAGARQKLITHNIANLSTPGFRPVDVSTDRFQAQLADAVERRREGEPLSGGLVMESTNEVEVDSQGITLTPRPIGENLLFHDGNDRSLERLMQDLTENFTTFRFAAEMMRNRMALINTAIRERL
jgi:flagellar basal-body rod protein FlgB